VRFRRREILVEATRVLEPIEEVEDWASQWCREGVVRQVRDDFGRFLCFAVHDSTGARRADKGDYLVVDPYGEVSVVKATDFVEEYEPE